MQPLMADTLRELVEADKSLAVAAEWTPRGRHLEFVSPLEIDGLVEEGFQFRASAMETRPDQDVVFQLEYHGVRIAGGTGPLARIEWNALRPHNNRGRGPRELRFVDQEGSHVHHFEDNWNEATGAMMRDNLPIARPVSEPIQGFSEALGFVGNLFRINNIELVKTPEWVYALDLGRG
jgi:hypothetical protein